MYCDKCGKLSPEQFKSCVYCGALFPEEKKRKLPKSIQQREKKRAVSKGVIVAAVLVFALLLGFAATLTAVFTSDKPEKVVDTLVKATQDNDSGEYMELYDDCILSYKKEYLYFEDAATVEAMCEPMRQSDEFYREKCGEGYKLSYTINNTTYSDAESVSAYSDYLKETYGYTKSVSKMALLDITVKAKGKNGVYETDYRDYLCIRVGGRWYHSEISTEESVSR